MYGLVLSAFQPLMPMAWGRTQYTSVGISLDQFESRTQATLMASPPAADVSWCTAAAVFALVGRVCCMSTCLTSGAAHAQCAGTLIPFVVSYRPARKRVNTRAASEDGVFPHTWTCKSDGCSASLPFYHRQEFLFPQVCRFLGNKFCSALVFRKHLSIVFFLWLHYTQSKPWLNNITGTFFQFPGQWQWTCIYLFSSLLTDPALQFLHAFLTKLLCFSNQFKPVTIKCKLGTLLC